MCVFCVLYMYVIYVYRTSERVLYGTCSTIFHRHTYCLSLWHWLCDGIKWQFTVTVRVQYKIYIFDDVYIVHCMYSTTTYSLYICKICHRHMKNVKDLWKIHSLIPTKKNIMKKEFFSALLNLHACTHTHNTQSKMPRQKKNLSTFLYSIPFAFLLLFYYSTRFPVFHFASHRIHMHEMERREENG